MIKFVFKVNLSLILFFIISCVSKNQDEILFKNTQIIRANNERNMKKTLSSIPNKILLKLFKAKESEFHYHIILECIRRDLVDPKSLSQFDIDTIKKRFVVEVYSNDWYNHSKETMSVIEKIVFANCDQFLDFFEHHIHDKTVLVYDSPISSGKYRTSEKEKGELAKIYLNKIKDIKSK